MGQSVSVEAKLDEQLYRKLSEMAERAGRKPAEMVAEAVRFFVQSEEDFIAAVDEGLADLDAGRSVPHETIVADFNRRSSRKG
jgi:predicted transcriptional regulator